MHTRIVMHGEGRQTLAAHNLCIRAIKLNSPSPDFELWIKPVYTAFVAD